MKLRSQNEYFSRFHFKFSPIDDIASQKSSKKSSHLVLLASLLLIYIHSMSLDIFSSIFFLSVCGARVKVNVIFLCDIKIISNTFMDISRCVRRAFHVDSIL